MFAIPTSRTDLFKAVFKNRLSTSAALWVKLPLAAFAGLRITRLDGGGAEVTLPAGWKTQNPFRSTYFAAQAMAAEMSTGAPALLFIEESGQRISSLVTGLNAKFTKKATRPVTFTFAGGPEMRTAIERAGLSDEGVDFTAHTVGKMPDGTVVAEFDISWSFKRKNK